MTPDAAFAVVAVPGGRRAALFAEACRGQGLREPAVIDWRDVLRGADIRVEPGTLLRIDSPGEDPETDALLRGPGDPTRVAGSARWYAAFTAGLRRVASAAGGAATVREAGAANEADAVCEVGTAGGAGAVCKAGAAGRAGAVREAGAAIETGAVCEASAAGGAGVSGGAGAGCGAGASGTAAAAGGARLLGDPYEIAVMFDKRRCHSRLDAAGVPVPSALPPVRGYGELRARMAEAGCDQVFVKPAHGSSASGVVALRTAPGRIKAVTSAARDAHGVLHNSLRVRSYETEPEVAALIDDLAPDGLHVENWLPKASIGGRVFDLRVVVVAGTPTHAVVRTSRHPMTNLHLGGARGDLPAVRAWLGERGWRRALEVCAGAAACFPGSLMVGVDLLVGVGGRRLAVAEVNAFGDLLPGLTGLPDGGAEGLDTYTAQVVAALTRKTLACAT